VDRGLETVILYPSYIPLFYTSERAACHAERRPRREAPALLSCLVTKASGALVIPSLRSQGSEPRRGEGPAFAVFRPKSRLDGMTHHALVVLACWWCSPQGVPDSLGTRGVESCRGICHVSRRSRSGGAIPSCGGMPCATRATRSSHSLPMPTTCDSCRTAAPQSAVDFIHVGYSRALAKKREAIGYMVLI